MTSRRRRRAAAAILLLVLAGGLAACRMVSSTGRTATETRPVSGFSAVQLDGSGEVAVRQTGAESVTIEAEEAVLHRVTAVVSGRTLRLGVRAGMGWSGANPIRYRVTVRSLDEVAVTGSGSVEVSDLSTPRLHADISGSGRITLAGSAETQSVDLSGSGVCDADALTGRTADVRVSGSGQVVVAVTDRLDATISGSGSVTYRGTPEVNQQITGSGRLIHR